MLREAAALRAHQVHQIAAVECCQRAVGVDGVAERVEQRLRGRDEVRRREIGVAEPKHVGLQGIAALSAMDHAESMRRVDAAAHHRAAQGRLARDLGHGQWCTPAGKRKQHLDAACQGESQLGVAFGAGCDALEAGLQRKRR